MSLFLPRLRGRCPHGGRRGFWLKQSTPIDPRLGAAHFPRKQGKKVIPSRRDEREYSFALAVESLPLNFNSERVFFHKTYIWCIVIPALRNGCIVLLGGENDLAAA